MKFPVDPYPLVETKGYKMLDVIVRKICEISFAECRFGDGSDSLYGTVC